jgi:hypothetical protein
MVIVLVLAAVAAGLYAFWLSIRQQRRFRRLVVWIKAHHGERWRALPWASRHLNLVGAVEALRRGELGDDPVFVARYRDGKRGRMREFVAILVGFGLIGVLALGIRYLGWHW